jgi:RNAse (barnase) inhibitor barstar
MSELEPGGAAVRQLPIGRADADLLCAVAGERGFSAAVADLAGCHDKEEFLARVAVALDFPQWFGRNWDAFFDCLADLSWLPGDSHVLVLLNAVDLQGHAPESFDTAVSLMQEAGAAWDRRGRFLRVLIDLPAPPRPQKRRPAPRPGKT